MTEARWRKKEVQRLRWRLDIFTHKVKSNLVEHVLCLSHTPVHAFIFNSSLLILCSFYSPEIIELQNAINFTCFILDNFVLLQLTYINMRKQIIMGAVYIFQLKKKYRCNTRKCFVFFLLSTRKCCYMSKFFFLETIHQWQQLYEQIVSQRGEKDMKKSAMNIVEGVYNLQISLFNCP